MMGRSHAVSAAAVWVWAAPHLGVEGAVPIAGSLLLAAGAGVLPDLDHPDARPSRQFGILSKMVSKVTAKAAGGHRKATHSISFALLAGGVLWAVEEFQLGDVSWRRVLMGLFAWFLATVGFSLTAPSLGVRVPPWVGLLVGAGLGVWVWSLPAAPVWFPALVALGSVVHIFGDWLTKGGVPVLFPFTRKRWRAGLFRTGGRVESFVAVVFWLILFAGLWRYAGLPFPDWASLAGSFTESVT